jgi:hypothetical protein
MLPPPEERLYATFQDLHEDLKKWTLSQGYAVSIDASSNRDASGVYRRYNMSCVKGGKSYKPTAQGKRKSYSKKTGCPMKIKCTKQDGWPWNGRWRVTVMCGDHNHPPFDPESSVDVPPAFRHIEGEGLRWLLIMHREAQLNLRQLTIGLRATFGDKYKFIKKADVSNSLSKVKREEEREMAKRPPGAPPLPPGTMTAFMAALLNPIPDPYENGVRYELVSAAWPTVPGYQSAAAIQQQQQQQQQHQQAQQQAQQQQPLPQAPTPQYTQQVFQPQPFAQPQQMQGQPVNYGPPQQYVPPQQQQPPPGQAGYSSAPATTSPRPIQWKNYNYSVPPGNAAPPTQAGAAPQAQTSQQPQGQQQAQQQTQQPNPQQQQQQPQAQDPSQPPPPQQPDQVPPQAQAQQQPVAQGGPPPQSIFMSHLTVSQPVYRSTGVVQPVAVDGVPGAVVMPRSFSPVSEDESANADDDDGNDDDDVDADGDGEDE